MYLMHFVAEEPQVELHCGTNEAGGIGIAKTCTKALSVPAQKPIISLSRESINVPGYWLVIVGVLFPYI